MSVFTSVLVGCHELFPSLATATDDLAFSKVDTPDDGEFSAVASTLPRCVPISCSGSSQDRQASEVISGVIDKWWHSSVIRTVDAKIKAPRQYKPDNLTGEQP
jgi:hypothetical protein